MDLTNKSNGGIEDVELLFSSNPMVGEATVGYGDYAASSGNSREYIYTLILEFLFNE